MQELFLVTTLWAAWCGVHSLLISRAVKDAIFRLFPVTRSYFRLAYCGVSLITLIPLCIYTVQLPQSVVFTFHGLFRLFQICLAVYSVILFAGGVLAYDMQYFLGIRQLRHGRDHLNNKQENFQQHGILQIVRHPWYSAGIALLWCSPTITDIGLSIRLLLTLYFTVGAYLEENRLLHQFGTPYKRYRKEVPMLIPNFLKILRKCS
ncbi:methyltransferase family protein [Desulfogranum japonicum]|uniref:methyltransferase family protein n=1 Tax=Desulfogranum japonicum TaxID=231447 RepID=UPI000685C4B6|nr:NnrU family protein [Desulfogranum japonicum]